MTQDKFPNDFSTQEEISQPGIEKDMNPAPIYSECNYINDGKRLKNKIAIVTGGDSGIGRAISLAFAREGAKVIIIYLNESEDAKKTLELIEKENSEGLLIEGDIGSEDFCLEAIKTTVEKFGTIDILINNAGEQHTCTSITEITQDQLIRTFKTNVFGAFYMTKAALPHMKKGSSIINTTSITAYHGNKDLIDYSSTKGALTSFTRSLALNLASKGIRVNAVVSFFL